MEKKTILAFALSLAVFVIWGLLFSPKQSEQPVPEAGKGTAASEAQPAVGETRPSPPSVPAPAPTSPQTSSAPAAPATPPAPGVQPAALPITGGISVASAADIKVQNSVYTAVFSESGGRLKHLYLHNYRTEADPNSPPKDVVAVDSPEDIPMGLSFGKQGPNLKFAEFKADKSGLQLSAGDSEKRLTFTYKDPSGLEVVRTYSFMPDSYLIGMNVKILNKTGSAIENNLILEADSAPLTLKETYAGFAALLNDKLVQIKPKDMKEKLAEESKQPYTLEWAAYGDQYFLAGVLPPKEGNTAIDGEAYGEKGIRMRFINPTFNLQPGSGVDYQYSLFYGPKDYSILKSLKLGLDKSIDFGWFNILSRPLLVFMTWLYKYVGNYGIVIILITVMIKIIFWPLTAKSYKSMKNMQKLQPKIMKLREKYKGDREAMNREMMQLYRTYKVNPMGGCLPMVIQIPVFISLYRLLDYSLELRHAPFWLWIKDLSAPDRLFNFGFHIPYMQDPTGIPVLTLLMGASMLLQQKMTPTPGDPTQAKIMMLMPIFFTVIFINFPAGLVLYWLVNNILSIGQQTLINKRAN